MWLEVYMHDGRASREPPNTQDDPAYPEALREAEAALLGKRRGAVQVPFERSTLLWRGRTG
jgi:hypothetical protein